MSIVRDGEKRKCFAQIRVEYNKIQYVYYLATDIHVIFLVRSKQKLQKYSP
jgi:hypothetical protein